MANDKYSKKNDDGMPTRIPGMADMGTKIPGADATRIAGGGRADATRIAGGGAADATRVAHGASPAGPHPGAPSTVNDIPLLTEYVLNGIRYTVDQQSSAKTLSKRSGEARIFVVENGGRKFVLKIYIPNHGPEHFVLDRVQKATGGFLVALRDHGKWTAPGGGTFDYEVMDYMPYGSLADTCLRGFENRFKEVALRMAFAIRQCHSLGVIHRDIKPENFLYTSADKKDFVMIDFGIARGYSGDKRPVKVDAAKSSYFVSPEGAISSTDRTTYVGPATDYYSMGMTLLALWLGTDNFYRMFPPEDLAELDRLKRNNNVIGKLRPKLNMSDHCASLLERLLEFSDNSRAGFDEVQRWYKGETLKTGSAAEAESARSTFNVVFNDIKKQVARSPEELARLMLGDVEFAKKFLYKGLAKSALQGIRPTLAIEIDDITQTRYPRPDQQGMGVYAAALLLDPSMVYTGVKGDKCTTPKQIAADVWNNADKYFGSETKTVGGISPADRLWVYLSVRGDSKLKAFPDKYRAILRQSPVNGIYALVLGLDPDMPLMLQGKTFDINSGKEIAAEFWRDRKRYVRDLADPYHPFWLKFEQGCPEIKVLIDTEIDHIKRNGEYALYGRCLSLDPKFPLYSDDGKRALRTQNEIAQELLDVWLWKPKDFGDRYHPLWSYLKHFGGQWKTIGETYPDKVARTGNNTWLWELYYRLGSGKKAFNIQYADDQKWYYVYSLAELVKNAAEHGLTDFSVMRLTCEHFPAWLAANGVKEDAPKSAVAEKIVKDLGQNASKMGWYLLYSLMPEIGIAGTTSKTAEYSGYTAKDLGRLLNIELSESRTYMHRFPSKQLINALKNGPEGFRGSQMWQYMKARKMDAHIDGICRIIDLPANQKAHPAVNYTDNLAMWKVVQYLGHVPTLYCAKSKKHVSTLAELKTIPASERYEMSTKPALRNFVALFFHERAGRKFNIDDVYSYLTFMSDNNCNGVDTIGRFHTSDDAVNNARAARDKAWQSISRTRKIVTIVSLIPMAIILGWMVGVSFSDGASTLSTVFMSIGQVIGVLLAIVGVLAGLSGGIFGAILGGLAGYWIPIWTFNLLSGIAPLILTALLGGAAVWCAINLFKQGKDKHIPTATAYNNLVEQGRLYAVTQAYGSTTRVFGGTNMANPVDTFRASASQAQSQKKSIYKAMAGMIGLTVVTLAIGIALIGGYQKAGTEPQTEAVAETQAVSEITMEEAINGDYEGTFDGRQSTITLECSSTDNPLNYDLKGTITISYSKPKIQEVQGKYYPRDQSYLMHPVKNGKEISKEMYQGHFSNVDGKLHFDGRYTNLTKGTNHNYSFEKVPYQE